MKKHLIAALLLCGMLLSFCLASCNNNSEESSAAPSENSQTASAEESKEDLALVPHLGKRDLGGFTYLAIGADDGPTADGARLAAHRHLLLKPPLSRPP